MIIELTKLGNSSKYLSVYSALVNRATDRIGGISTKVAMKRQANRVIGYAEAHHIIPKSINPEYRLRRDNLVYLTPREHFICHLLLERIFRGTKEHSKMLYALNWISNKHKVKSVAYSELKYKFIEANRQKALSEMQDPERKQKFVQAGLESTKAVRDADTKAWVENSMGSQESKAKAKATNQSDENREKCRQRELAKPKEERKAFAKLGQLALVEKLGGEEAYRKWQSDKIKGRKKYINMETGDIKVSREPIEGYIRFTDRRY